MLSEKILSIFSTNIIMSFYANENHKNFDSLGVQFDIGT